MTAMRALAERRWLLRYLARELDAAGVARFEVHAMTRAALLDEIAWDTRLRRALQAIDATAWPALIAGHGAGR